MVLFCLANLVGLCLSFPVFDFVRVARVFKIQPTTLEQNKAFLEKILADIDQGTISGSNIVFDCTLPRLETYNYCLKHIFQDPRHRITNIVTQKVISDAESDANSQPRNTIPKRV